MLYHSRVSIIILTFSGAERSKETLSLISLAQRKKEKKLISSQPSNLPCPKEDFEPLPDPRQSLARTQHWEIRCMRYEGRCRMLLFHIPFTFIQLFAAMCKYLN